MVGKRLSHYAIEEKLGQGGMGEVYRASDTKLGRHVAIKVLPAGFASDAERMARFQREAQVLASLNHPHIAQIFGVEEDGDTHALVLELVEGPTLSDLIAAGRMPADEILKIALQIARALETAHEQGIVHRDLKPDNVKLTEAGEVKVLDFGLAKAMEAGPSDGGMTQSPTISPAITGAMTAANVILGTAGYMSPEQARGQPVDRRCDIWSFGVVLYEMLTARRLFVGDTVSDTIAAVLRLDPDWEALPAGTPRRVRRLLRRCLERDPNRRLRDIGEARITLEEVRDGGPDDREPDAPAAPAARPRGGPLVAVGIAALAIGGVLGVLGQRWRQPEPPLPPVVRFEIPMPELRSFGGTTFAISHDGRRFAYTTEEGLWVRELSELEPRALPGTEGALEPFFSPDGEWVGYGDRERLSKIRVQGGTPQTVCELEHPFDLAAGGAWGEDGRIVFTDGNGHLSIVSAQGGDPDTVLGLDPEGDQDFHDVTALPGGRAWVFVVHRKGGSFDRIDLSTNGWRKPLVTMEGEQLRNPVWSPPGFILFQRTQVNPGTWAVPFSLARLETTGEPFLVAAELMLPTVSRSGTMITSSGPRQGTSQLRWIDRKGAPGERVGRDQNQMTYFPLSPDGRRVVLRANPEGGGLYVLDLVRQTQSRLTFTDASERFPVWSVDGRHIYYEDATDFPRSMLWMTSSDGSSAPIEIGPGITPAPSPDGRVLVYSLFSAETNNDWDLWYRRLDENGVPAGEPQLFLDNEAILVSPRVSPNGRLIAYVSQESGRAEVYLKRFPSGSGKWQVSVEGGHHPRWDGDGTELFFADDDDIRVVSVSSDPVSLGTPERLFTRPDRIDAMPFSWPDAFEVTPDGERFLIAVLPEGHHEDERAFVVTQNWFSELAPGVRATAPR